MEPTSPNTNEYDETDIDWIEVFPKIQGKYTESVMTEMLKAMFEKRLAHIRKWRDKVWADNDELRLKGVPFEERKKLLNTERLKFCDEYEAKMLHDQQHFKPMPIYHWFDQDDYWSAKLHGFEWVLKSKFEEAYYVPNK